MLPALHSLQSGVVMARMEEHEAMQEAEALRGELQELKKTVEEKMESYQRKFQAKMVREQTHCDSLVPDVSSLLGLVSNLL